MPNKKKSTPIVKTVISLIISLILLVTAINEILENDNNTIQDTVLQGNLSKELKVHYIDVGQGDSILIEVGNASMLIDAGNNGDGNRIVSYIKDQGINKLDYLILTHPHADHIGGATDVIKALDIDKIIMPKVNHTSKTYENLLLTIKDKDLKITVPNTGDDYSLGGSSFKILAPNSSNYERMNDYSIVCKLTFGNTSFLFSGDAETISENEMLSKGFDLKADVLKLVIMVLIHQQAVSFLRQYHLNMLL